MRQPNRVARGFVFSVLFCGWIAPAGLFAGPNLIALGSYTDVPYKRAEGRDSFNKKEIVYSFTDPEFDFGRIVVRPAANAALSVVRRDLFVGFDGNTLIVHTQPAGRGGNIQIQELEFWLKINGNLRSGGSYEWELEGVADTDRIEGGFPAVIPAFWADGEPVGTEVTIRTPEPEDTDRISRLLLPHGIVTLKEFEEQTGAAWVVLKPRNYGSFVGLRQLSFREVDTDAANLGKVMPTPVRYIPIRSPLEDDIRAVLDRSPDVLKNLRNADHFWPAPNPEDSVSLTAGAIGGLAELDPKTDKLKETLDWLAKQEPPANPLWGVGTVANRLRTLSRHGGMKEYSRTINHDVQFLVDAQSKEGSWGVASALATSRPAADRAASRVHTLASLLALREARFAGAEVDRVVWTRASQYWTNCQSYDGAFATGSTEFGLQQGVVPTTGNTGSGITGLLIAVDMLGGLGAKQCRSYLSSKEQLQAVTRAIDWLDKKYQDETPGLIFREPPDPYGRPDSMQLLSEISGITHLNKKRTFEEEARQLIDNYDRASGLFGLRGQDGNVTQTTPYRTAYALSILASGAAPTVVQRLIVGDAESGFAQFRGDVSHLTRYLAAKRERQFNWRRTFADRSVREWAEVPILVINVMGPFSWADAEWNKLREYAFSGGSIVIDVADDASDQRATVLAGLKKAFPEYEPAELQPDSAVFSAESDRVAISGLFAIGNGFRHFVFLPRDSWSCHWQQYQLNEHAESFKFMNNLLTYATDGSPPRSSFAPSTYPLGAASSKSIKAARLQVGSIAPAHPSLLSTMDRLLQDNFRLAVVEETEFGEADLVWVNVAGTAAPSDEAKGKIRDTLKNRKLLWVDVVGGRKESDDAFRKSLKSLDAGVSLEPLPRTDPLYTGEIPGTQGFDVVTVAFRKALHSKWAESGRCELYVILKDGKPAGYYCAYDISSGIGYQYFPGCRGVMPETAREIAMNAFLIAYGWKTGGVSAGKNVRAAP